MTARPLYWPRTPSWGLLDPEEAQNNIIGTLADPMVAHAYRLSFEGFIGRMRKIPQGDPQPRPIPYFKHPLEVAILLAQFGYPPVIVAAGFMHDHIEDLDWEKSRLVDEFHEFGDGPAQELAEIVATLSVDKALEWTQRREQYRQQVADGPVSARPVACADKISNMRASEVLARRGFAPQNYLTMRWRENFRTWEELSRLFESSVHPLLLEEYQQRLAVWKAWGLRLESRYDGQDE